MSTRSNTPLAPHAAYPAPSAVLELLKPVTWFPPMWAFACGVVSSGVPVLPNAYTAIVGVVLAGPLVVATSQAINDWYDRDVDAINEPQRPIPSGRIPGRWGFYIACVWTVLSTLVAATLGTWVLIAAVLGLLLAWIYSAPPLRLKQNGWWGNAACGFSYESLAWITGAAAMLGGALPPLPVLAIAILYGAGAHGIMTLNDFKAIRGDREMGILSLPVQLGADRAAWVASAFMAAPQIVVIALLLGWGRFVGAGVVALLLIAQLAMMRRFLRAPVERALWYSGFGVPLYVLGMMASAFALRAFAAG
ncbi:chlorophyll synthase [Roseiarcus fermentans]|uniref:Chlorophyll synthase n=1 Tax=Roseiarcus fermentans TaxID=1473586 RepID=A0A366FCG3_9HYPH|nr:chlorophyll synthase ChlG [Roseiarcus fermentans]RBP11395.1 chlorophyll synthase [Roseiarcus fermentans]